MLQIHHLTVNVGKKSLIRDIDLELAPSKIYMLLGPNGSGKSTLIKAATGMMAYSDGDVHYNDKPLAQWREVELARCRAVLSQGVEMNFPLKVWEVVRMGRFPHIGTSAAQSDASILAEVIKLFELETLLERNYLTLSGGERQRVQFARVMAQLWDVPADQPRYLFMDEPLTFLDINHQLDILHLLRQIVDKRTVCLVSMHDLNLALHHGDQFILLQSGKLVAHGDADTVLSNAHLQQVFGISARRIPVDGTGDVVLHFENKHQQ